MAWVCGCPCSSSTGGPLPAWRRLMTASGVSIRRWVKVSNMMLLSYTFRILASAGTSPGAALAVVDVDDAVPIDLEASHLRVAAQIGHHAAPANPEVDGAAGEMKGVAGAAGTPVAAPVAVGGFDAHRAELLRHGGDDLAQIVRNASGRSAVPQC